MTTSIQLGAPCNRLEFVVCAAILTHDGKVIRGNRHNNCLLVMQHEGIDHRNRIDGFITSHNRFVDRELGFKIQKFAGIPSASPDGYHGKELYSEDLY